MHVEFLVSSERVKNFAPAEAGFAYELFIYLLFRVLVHTHASK